MLVMTRRFPRLALSIGLLAQAALLIAIFVMGWTVARNTSANLAAMGLTGGFDFLGREAGFGIGFSVIAYDETRSFARAFLVGLTNTLLASAIGIVLATVLGVAVGLLRLSPNWLLSRLALGGVEVIRNIPLLLHLLFWAGVLLAALPPVRQSLDLAGLVWLNNRGIYLPAPAMGAIWALLAGGLAVLLGAAWLSGRARRTTGRGWPWPIRAVVTALAAGLIVGGIIGTDWEIPRLAGFNFRGGIAIPPELAALVAGLAIYNAAFIAEIVRGALLSVAAGQWEAAASLGLTRRRTLWLVILPQTLRIALPPVTNQYLHLLKASSLATAIGYPDLVNVFTGTVLNQTGRAVEIVLMTLLVYLVLSLLISLAMNALNRRQLRRGDARGFAPPTSAAMTHTAFGPAAAPRGGLRARLFPTPTQGLISLIAMGLVLWLGGAVIDWAVLRASWSGSARADCADGGACWAFVTARIGQFVYGFYPAPERWRVDLAAGLLVLGVGALAWPRVPRKGMIAVVMLAIYPAVALWLLYGGPGLGIVESKYWGGLMLTLVIGVTGIVTALPLGMVLALARRSHLPVLRWAAVGFIELWRGVPLITVLFVALILLPLFLPQGAPTNDLVLALIGISFYASAYMAEVIRGGLQAVARGQYEAAHVLGLGYRQQMLHVVLPQALRHASPGIVNTSIALLKDTTLVMIIGLFDLVNIVLAGTNDPAWLGSDTEAYVFVGAVFWVLCFGFGRYAHALERRLSPGRAR